MSAPPDVLQTRLDGLWAEWLAARDKASRSNNIQDGIAAGRAWSRWLAEFCPEGQRETVHRGVARHRK